MTLMLRAALGFGVSLLAYVAKVFRRRRCRSGQGVSSHGSNGGAEYLRYRKIY